MKVGEIYKPIKIKEQFMGILHEENPYLTHLDVKRVFHAKVNIFLVLEIYQKYAKILIDGKVGWGFIPQLIYYISENDKNSYFDGLGNLWELQNRL